MNNFKWGIIAAIFAFIVSIIMGAVYGVAVVHIFLRALLFTAIFFGIGFGIHFLISGYLPEILEGDVSNEEAYSGGQSHEGGDDTSVSTVLNNTGEYALPELFKSSADSNEIGNIEDLISGAFNPNRGGYVLGKGIDANSEAGYNVRGESQDFSLGLPEEIPFGDSDYNNNSEEDEPEERPVFTPSFGDDGGMGGLPDLDMMASAFSSFGGAPAQSQASAPAPSFVPTGIPESFSTAGGSGGSSPPPESSSSAYKGNKPETLKGDFNPKELAEGIRAVLSKEK